MDVEIIREQLKEIRKNIKKACKKSERNPEDVKIIVVTRNQNVPEIRDVVEAGCSVFGENRVQEALQKISFCDPELEWHLIGHLQSVKAKAAVKNFDLIHTVDGLRIGFDLQRACEKEDAEANILIQINTTGEESQFGVEPSEAIPLLRELVKCPQVKIRGLMTEFQPLDNPEDSRPFYQALREVRDEIVRAGLKGVEMKWLSMGVSHDYIQAVEEGANLIRITSPIFSEER